MGVSEDKLDEYINMVNDISNLQLLAAQLNEEKLNTDFDKWFTNQYKTDSDKIQYRTINYLPQMEYSYANFLTFMNERRKLLKAELLKILL
jgi:endonuclease I